MVENTSIARVDDGKKWHDIHLGWGQLCEDEHEDTTFLDTLKKTSDESLTPIGYIVLAVPPLDGVTGSLSGCLLRMWIYEDAVTKLLPRLIEEYSLRAEVFFHEHAEALV